MANQAQYSERTDESRLRLAYKHAQQQWPGVAVDWQIFSDHVVSRAQSGEQSGDALGGPDLSEVYLALACARGDHKAFKCFERMYFDQICPALAKFHLSPYALDEVKQVVRCKLFIDQGDGTPIVKYAGTGQLAGLVRVAAVRAALNHLEKHANQREVLSSTSHRLDNRDPELLLLKKSERAAFKALFREAVEQLSYEQRALIRLKFVKNLSIDEIATLQRVHRATAARRVQRAHKQLVATTQRLIVDRWQLSESEMLSMGTLIESQLSLSLARLLRSDAPSE